MKGLALFGTLADGTTERACYHLCVETCPTASEWSHPAGATHEGSTGACLGRRAQCCLGVCEVLGFVSKPLVWHGEAL